MTRIRPPLLILSVLLLLTTLWAGLLRLGWSWPTFSPSLAGLHGPLMIAGFFGALIALERAVALDDWWAYLSPIAALLGSILALSGFPAIGAGLFLTGSLIFLGMGVVMLRRQTAAFTILLFVSILALTIGNLLWLLGNPVYQIVWWWAAFLVLTIAAERLELGRMLRLPQWALPFFWLSVAITLLGLLANAFHLSLGLLGFGLGFLLLAIWLGLFDIARKTVHKPGLPRFAAICLLSGYFWLGLGGALIMRFGGTPAGFYYDAMLHTVFVGFVFGMIFGHAPIIFPAVLGLPITFRSQLYAPLILLTLSLALRIFSDLFLWIPGRLWGGLFNGIAILLYLLSIGSGLLTKPQ